MAKQSTEAATGEAETSAQPKERETKRLRTVRFEPLRCPKCHALKPRTTSTDPVEGKNLTYRTHTCVACGFAFRSESPSI